MYNSYDPDDSPFEPDPEEYGYDPDQDYD